MKGTIISEIIEAIESRNEKNLLDLHNNLNCDCLIYLSLRACLGLLIKKRHIIITQETNKIDKLNMYIPISKNRWIILRWRSGYIIGKLELESIELDNRTNKILYIDYKIETYVDDPSTRIKTRVVGVDIYER
mgnify:CR=1 FL=1